MKDRGHCSGYVFMEMMAMQFFSQFKWHQRVMLYFQNNDQATIEKHAEVWLTWKSANAEQRKILENTAAFRMAKEAYHFIVMLSTVAHSSDELDTKQKDFVGLYNLLKPKFSHVNLAEVFKMSFDDIGMDRFIAWLKQSGVLEKGAQFRLSLNCIGYKKKYLHAVYLRVSTAGKIFFTDSNNKTGAVELETIDDLKAHAEKYLTKPLTFKNTIVVAAYQFSDKLASNADSLKESCHLAVCREFLGMYARLKNGIDPLISTLKSNPSIFFMDGSLNKIMLFFLEQLSLCEYASICHAVQSKLGIEVLQCAFKFILSSSECREILEERALSCLYYAIDQGNVALQDYVCHEFGMSRAEAFMYCWDKLIADDFAPTATLKPFRECLTRWLVRGEMKSLLLKRPRQIARLLKDINLDRPVVSGDEVIAAIQQAEPAINTSRMFVAVASARRSCAAEVNARVDGEDRPSVVVLCKA